MSDFHEISSSIGGMVPASNLVRREYVSYLASYDQVEQVTSGMVSNLLAQVLVNGSSIYAGNIVIRLDHGETSDALSVTVKWQPDE